MIFGSIGTGYFIYGKKQQNTIALITGLLLAVYPYFVSNWVLVILIGVVLMSVPFIIKN